MKMEFRMNPVQIDVNEDSSLTVRGYVNETETWSQLLGHGERFKEKIQSGAFDRAVQKATEIHFLAEHDNKKILSSTRNGSLTLKEDQRGLYMEATIVGTSWGKDYYELIKSGILNNMSFGFRAIKDAWKKVDGYFERTVQELELFEVSVVRDPAYSQSSISARGIDLVIDEVPQAELDLRTIEIRSDADIEAIAKKLFDMISANVKIAEGKEEIVEEIVDEVVEDIIEDEIVEDIIVADPIIEDIVVEDVVDPVVEELSDTTAANKIRDFINKFN